MKDMYRSTLEIFYKKITLECNNMTAFLDANDLESCMISVHTMKSSLATIGAMRLSETALDLETASKNDDFDYCARLFPEFKEKLLSLHGKLSVIFPAVESPQKKGSGDMGLLRENVHKALAAAEDFDNDTGIEIVNNLLAFDFGGKNNVLLENALTALENFEFENAADIFRKIE
jgi:HPt (histidine-containing phosphotransfer) domain-containing protein